MVALEGRIKLELHAIGLLDDEGMPFLTLVVM